ncbi:MAG TPA: hypothetical protein VH134_06085 [Candidatus Dormibacteraeota bacterium]|jgi:hypothetical protein|nr:hypothetical protein [Candidatus Dormibacteraeota bacterium]
MPRAQKKRAARMAASGHAAAPPAPQRPRPRPERAAPPAVDEEVPPWSARSLLILAGLVVALQVPLAVLDMVRDNHRYAFPVYLIVSLAPVSPLQQFEVLAAYVITMPVAARLAREARLMRLLETMSVAAIALILLFTLWELDLALVGGRGVGEKGEIHLPALLGGALADVVGLGGASLAYPVLYRRFWMPRRRLRR